RGHEVDVVGEVLPGAGDAGDLGLTAELAFSADLAGDAGHFGGERVELVDHRVDGIFQFQNFAADVDRDLLRQVAIRDRNGDLGYVADLAGQVVGHRVDALGQILPDAGHLRYLSLAAELALGADLARHARHFRGEHGKLLDHRVDDVGRLQEFTAKWAAVDIE